MCVSVRCARNNAFFQLYIETLALISFVLINFAIVWSWHAAERDAKRKWKRQLLLTRSHKFDKLLDARARARFFHFHAATNSFVNYSNLVWQGENWRIGRIVATHEIEITDGNKNVWNQSQSNWPIWCARCALDGRQTIYQEPFNRCKRPLTICFHIKIAFRSRWKLNAMDDEKESSRDGVSENLLDTMSSNWQRQPRLSAQEMQTDELISTLNERRKNGLIKTNCARRPCN